MFFSKRKFIAFLFLFCLILSVFFLSSRTLTYNSRALVIDFHKIPLILATALSNEARAVLFFHKSYWQNLKLTAENAGLKAQLNNQKDEAAENERLRRLLDLKSKISFHTQIAKVIGKDFSSLRPYLIIDRGRTSGIKKYMSVLTSSGLVGKVLEVGLFSSKLILINDPDLSVPALNERTREQGLVSGTLDGRCKLRFLDSDSTIQEGDLIVTSGLNGSYPPQILIGKVRWVGVESSGLGKFAILEPAVKISSLEEVLVIIA